MDGWDGEAAQDDNAAHRTVETTRQGRLEWRLVPYGCALSSWCFRTRGTLERGDGRGLCRGAELSVDYRIIDSMMRYGMM